MTSDVVRYVDGFSTLITGVADYFDAVGVTALVLCGYRERAKQAQGSGGANRVVFLPGDLNGNGGKIAPPHDVGRRMVEDEDAAPAAEVRPLASWARQFMIAIWAVDTATPRDELAQTRAVIDLFESTLQAVEQVTGAGGPNVEWGSVAWTVPKENTFGAELLVGLQLIHPLMDAPADVGSPGFTLHRVGIDP